jgi:hypothetical protein
MAGVSESTPVPQMLQAIADLVRENLVDQKIASMETPVTDEALWAMIEAGQS